MVATDSYTIEAFDADGFSMGATDRDTIKEAKERAKYMLTPAYANAIETERAAVRVEILNGEGDCVWDKTLSKMPLLTIRFDSAEKIYFASNDNTGESWIIEGAKNQGQAVKMLRNDWNNPFRIGC